MEDLPRGLTAIIVTAMVGIFAIIVVVILSVLGS